MFSFVIPTRNEFHSISNVISDLCHVIVEDVNDFRQSEIVIVDDSDTRETIDVARHTALTWPSVKLSATHRDMDQRDGLTGAILTGIRSAHHDRIVVLDGDGQHPISAVRQISRKLGKDWDLVFGSRYRLVGGDHGLPNRIRRAGSRVINARLRASLKLGDECTDPLTGLFGLNRSRLCIPEAGHGGWKAAFLILTRNQSSARYTEVGFQMNKRLAGESKLGPVTAVRILWELHKARAESARS